MICDEKGCGRAATHILRCHRVDHCMDGRSPYNVWLMCHDHAKVSWIKLISPTYELCECDAYCAHCGLQITRLEDVVTLERLMFEEV